MTHILLSTMIVQKRLYNLILRLPVQYLPVLTASFSETMLEVEDIQCDMGVKQIPWLPM